MDDQPKEQEEQPVRSRRALAGDSLVTDTAVGDERIFGWQPRDQPRPDADQVDEEPPTNEQIGVLDPRRGGGQPDKEAAARAHWINRPDW
jgi:hypothetical protein